MMTPRARLLAALKGEKVDRMPWSPNPAYWWQAQPEAFRALGEVKALESFGCDPLIRGHAPENHMEGSWQDLRMYDTHYDGCTIDMKTIGDKRVTRIQTPIGALEAEYRQSSVGNTWFLSTHPVKATKDYEILAYLYDHTELTPNDSLFLALEAEYGEDALFIPQLALPMSGKSGLQSLLEYWVGTVQLVYDLYDEPEAIEFALDAMRRASTKAAQISADSPAAYFITWEDTSTTNISPDIYEKYILPEINGWCDVLGAKGKKYIQHACGHLEHMMPIMGASGISGIESISPPPTGNIELWDARKSMRPEQFLIGGIEPTVFLNASLEELESYVRGLLSRMEGTPFVLANSDSCPPGVSHEKFKLVSRIVRE